jgi:hypothetical protein
MCGLILNVSLHFSTAVSPSGHTTPLYQITNPAISELGEVMFEWKLGEPGEPPLPGGIIDLIVDKLNEVYHCLLSPPPHTLSLPPHRSLPPSLLKGSGHPSRGRRSYIKH